MKKMATYQFFICDNRKLNASELHQDVSFGLYYDIDDLGITSIPEFLDELGKYFFKDLAEMINILIFWRITE